MALEMLCFVLLAFAVLGSDASTSPVTEIIYNKITQLGLTALPQQEPYDPLDAKEALVLAFTSYCTASNISDWNCYWCNHSTFKPRHILVVSNPSYNSQCWMGIYKNTIILAFRGTQSTSLTNWLENFKTPLWNDTDSVLVHRGFLQTYYSLRPDIIRVLPRLCEICKNCSYLFTGHSLGGAMATLATVDLHRVLGLENIVSFTYGSPRVGNPEFHILHRKIVGTSYRIVNKRDVVPRVPTHIFEISGYSFWHVSTEVWYSTDDTTQYKICDGSGEDPTCSNSVPFLYCSVWDHSTYLGLNTTDGHYHGC